MLDAAGVPFETAAAPLDEARAKAGLAVALLDERERALQEAILFGPAPLGPGGGPDAPVLDEDPDMVLRALYANFPHPDIERLLLRRRG